MKYLYKLTSGKCLKIWFFCFLGVSIADYIYLFLNAEKFTPHAFDQLKKEPHYVVVVLIYFVFFSLPLSMIAHKLAKAERKRLLFVISTIIFSLSVIGIVRGLVILL